MPCRDQITFTIYLICAIIEVSSFGDILCSQKRNVVLSSHAGYRCSNVFAPWCGVHFRWWFMSHWCLCSLKKRYIAGRVNSALIQALFSDDLKRMFLLWWRQPITCTRMYHFLLIWAKQLLVSQFNALLWCLAQLQAHTPKRMSAVENTEEAAVCQFQSWCQVHP